MPSHTPEEQQRRRVIEEIERRQAEFRQQQVPNAGTAQPNLSGNSIADEIERRQQQFRQQQVPSGILPAEPPPPPPSPSSAAAEALLPAPAAADTSSGGVLGKLGAAGRFIGRGAELAAFGSGGTRGFLEALEIAGRPAAYSAELFAGPMGVTNLGLPPGGPPSVDEPFIPPWDFSATVQRQRERPAVIQGIGQTFLDPINAAPVIGFTRLPRGFGRAARPSMATRAAETVLPREAAGVPVRQGITETGQVEAGADTLARVRAAQAEFNARRLEQEAAAAPVLKEGAEAVPAAPVAQVRDTAIVQADLDAASQAVITLNKVRLGQPTTQDEIVLLVAALEDAGVTQAEIASLMSAKLGATQNVDALILRMRRDQTSLGEELSSAMSGKPRVLDIPPPTAVPAAPVAQAAAKEPFDPQLNNVPLSFVADRVATFDEALAERLRGIEWSLGTGRLSGRTETLLRDMTNEELVQLGRAMGPGVRTMGEVPQWLMSRFDPVPQTGTIQSGMGIGERAAQGELGLGGRIGAQEPVPLIDPAGEAAKATRRAQEVAGQRGLPEAVPPLPTNYVRLYRGEPSGFTRPPLPLEYGRTGRWFTTEIDRASRYGDTLFYVDVPKTVADASLVNERVATFELNVEWASKATPVRTESAATAAGQRGLPEAAATPPIDIPPQGPPAGGAPPPAAGVPPVGAVPPMAASQPAGREIDRIITQSREVVRQDRPGAISDLVQKVPGVRQTREFERPGLKMTGESESVLVAHIGETAARSDVTSRAMPTRVAVGRQLETAFGKKVVEGAELDVPFLGTSEQAASPLTRTLVDIAEYPELYQLTPAQAAALQALETRNTQLLEHVVQGYGAEIGQYPAKPGGAFLSHVDVPEDEIAAAARSSRGAASGQAKSRFYATARERLEADPTFKPELNVNKILNRMDSQKASAAAGQTFRESVGGLTKMEAMEKTHPTLFRRMTALRGKLASLRSSARTLDAKLQTAIDDFMASPVEDVDLADLRDSFDVTLAGGPRRGQGPAQIQPQLAQVQAEIAGLRQAWRSADLKPYALVQEGIFRYFQPEQASLVRELRRVSNNPVLNFLEGWRGGAFSGDLSPIVGVQTPLGALFDPLGSFKMGIGGVSKAIQEGNVLRSFTTKALAEDIAKDQTSWSQFFSLMGRAPTGTPSEFAGGYLKRIPGFGRFTESTFIMVTRQSKGMWERLTQDLINDGVPELVAQVAAAGKVTEVFPLMSPTRLGQSPARQTLLRALPTSYSFIRQPASLIAEATRGYAKVLMKQTLTPAERLAVRLITTFAGTVAAASVSSAVISAKTKGEDVKKAALDAVNPSPTNSRFASLVLGPVRVPIGGPYRGIFRAVFPKPVSGLPVPVPFAGLPQFFMNRLNPALATQWRLFAKNKDFYGRTIRKGDFPAQMMDGLRYEIEGAAPLAVGTTLEAQRSRASPKEIAVQTGGQFLGANVFPTETTREQVGQFEKGNILPPKGTSLQVLRTAYYQAGEGALSAEGRRAWREYEPLPSVERKQLLRTLPRNIQGEMLKVERYRTSRRQALRRQFPDLDVMLVEEAWNAKPQRNYTPQTLQGRQRQAQLRGRRYRQPVPVGR